MSSIKIVEKHQCAGTTTKKARCVRFINTTETYCHQHKPKTAEELAELAAKAVVKAAKATKVSKVEPVYNFEIKSLINFVPAKAEEIKVVDAPVEIENNLPQKESKDITLDVKNEESKEPEESINL